MLIFLCVCICVENKESTSTFTLLIVFLAPRLLQASVCVRRGKRCVWLHLESFQTPSPPLFSTLSVLFARRICQFSFALFVPALILLSKPWLASLTAAEHRYYSTSAKNMHSRQAGMMCAHTHSHSLLDFLSLFSPHTPTSVTTVSVRSLAPSVSSLSLSLSQHLLVAVKPGLYFHVALCHPFRCRRPPVLCRSRSGQFSTKTIGLCQITEQPQHSVTI